MINKNKLGLVLGCFFAIVHFGWSLAIAIFPQGTERFVNWIISLHMITSLYLIISFNLLNAIVLVAAAFIIGYILGWIFGAGWNAIMKK